MVGKDRQGEKLRLGGFFHPTGNHIAAWLHPGAQIDAGTNFQHYVQLTQAAERAKFDLIFVADAVATREGKLDALRRWPQYMAFFRSAELDGRTGGRHEPHRARRDGYDQLQRAV